MPNQQTISLTESTLYSDWDYFLAAAESLRIYLFEHQTIPTWNLHFCGGTPQLAVPHNWAFTWPSLFFYAMPTWLSNHVLWAVLTLGGIIGFYGFLRLFVSNRPACAAGASLYAINGYFAAKYDVGIPTFATFHVLPLLLYGYAAADRRIHEGKFTSTHYWALALGSCALFTAGLPHTLFYFYPAFIVFAGLLLLRDLTDKYRRRIWFVLFSSHVVGMLLSFYKLWPGVQWQTDSPRHTAFEFNSPWRLLENLVHPTKNLLVDLERSNFHRWGNWEYDAYVGIVPVVLCAVFGSSWLYQSWKDRRLFARDQLQKPQALVLTFCSYLYSSGHSACSRKPILFLAGLDLKKLPVVHGIRVFGRYQILTIVGVSIVLALSLAQIANILNGTRAAAWKARAILAALLIAILAPTFYQTYCHVRSIRYLPDSELGRIYPPRTGSVPILAEQQTHNRTELDYTHQTYLLKNGYWITNCYEPTQIPKNWPKSARFLPLTEPAPQSMELGHNRLKLFFDDKVKSVALNLPWTKHMKANPSPRVDADGVAHFDLSLPGSYLEIYFDIRPVLVGLSVSMMALFVLAIATYFKLLDSWIQRKAR